MSRISQRNQTITLFHADGTEEEESQLPGKWCICGHCDGRGTSSSYLGAFTASEWREQDDDFKEDYMAGHYDRPCDDCGGTGKVWGIAWERCTPEQQRALQEEIDYQAEVAAERRYGA